MNNVFSQRDFYGPLRISEYKNREDEHDDYIAYHPDDPSKLVRATKEGVYGSHEEMVEIVTATKAILKGLEDRGIQTVHPEYIDQTSESGEPYVLTVVDRIDDAVSYVDLVASGDMTPEIANEADNALCAMIDYTNSAIDNNGYIDSEIMHLTQFAFASSRPENERLVLVDVEAIGAVKIDMTRDSMQYGYPEYLIHLVSQLCVDVMILRQASREPLRCLELLDRLVDRLPGESDDTRQSKEALHQAIRDGQLNPIVLRLDESRGIYTDDDQDDW